MQVFTKCEFLSKEINNEYTKDTLIENYSKILTTMIPVIPHFSSECLKCLEIKNTEWPKFNKDIIEETDSNFVVQINGKKRGIVKANKQILKTELIALIKKDHKINKYIENTQILKSIFVPKKLINFIIKND